MAVSSTSFPRQRGWKPFKKGEPSWNAGTSHYREKHSIRGSREHKEKLSNAMKRRIGSLAPNWKGGIENLVKNNERNDPAYVHWAREIKRRDKNICQLNSKECSGSKVVHHILPWSNYPDQRYEITNGIVLCQFHHPKTRVEEQRLISVLQELIGSKQ